jgi:hypothetical protein
MVWWAAILITLGLYTIGVIGALAKIPLLMCGIIIISGIWCAIDSRKIGLQKYKSGVSYNPVVLFICILVIWGIAFPWYLIVRGKILTGKAVLKDKFR